MKQVITNADDFGYRPDISEAIIQASKSGVLTSTTVLVNFLETSDNKLIQEAPSHLGFGLHLNITSGEPLTDNWKKKYGEFTRPKRNSPEQFNRELWIDFFKKFKTEDIYLEYKSQLDRFVDIFGELPTHIDSHHYSSAFDKSFPAFLRIAKENNLYARPQVAFDFQANQHPLGNIDHMAKKTRDLRKSGIKTTDYFSLLYFNRYENYLEVIANELQKVDDQQSIELSWHPGMDEDWRRKDLEILVDDELRDVFERQSCKLINYSELS